jgi:hypothetical protein
MKLLRKNLNLLNCKGLGCRNVKFKSLRSEIAQINFIFLKKKSILLSKFEKKKSNEFSNEFWIFKFKTVSKTLNDQELAIAWGGATPSTLFTLEIN